jgi:Ca2+-transporting ATPase
VISNRRLDNKFNIFEGVHRNWFFIGINFVMVGVQIMIIFVGGKAFGVVPLTGAQWGISIILGVLSIPVAVVIRLIPDEIVAKVIPIFVGKKPSPNIYLSNEDRFQWNQGIETIREELTFLKLVRGGRLNQLRFTRQDMKQNFSHIFRHNSKTDTPSELDRNPIPASQRRRRSRSNSAIAVAAMVPSIVAGSIGGWSPIEKSADGADSLKLPPSRKRSDLESQDGDNIREISPASGTSG